MEHKLILVLCISLLYKESRLNQLENSAELVAEIIKGVSIPESKLTGSKLREVMIECRKLILRMINNGPAHKYSNSSLRQKINILFSDDSTVLASLLCMLDEESNTEDKLQHDIADIKKELYSFKAKRLYKDMINSVAKRMSMGMDDIDVPTHAAMLTEELEKFAVMGNDAGKHPSIVDTVDFSNTDELVAMMNTAKEIDTGATLFKCGWQSLNAMMGGGFRGGETLLVSALEHNFKSGFCTALLTHIPLFNVAPVYENNKKPLLLRISFENDTITDIPWMYKYIRENVEGTPVKIKDIDPAIAGEYVGKFMTQNGWNFYNVRIDPSNFTNKDILDLLLNFIKDGYVINVLVIDYLSMILPSDSKSELYRDNMRRVRNFCSRRKIFFITPHQMSSEAKKLTRGPDAVESLVRSVVGKQYYAGCMQLGQEPDIELCIHIEKRKDSGKTKSYLEMHRGKHRGRSEIVPAELHYCCVPFKDIGTLPWDVDKANSAISKPGADFEMKVDSEFGWE